MFRLPSVRSAGLVTKTGRIAVPAMRQKFYPDSISTDLQVMNSGMKDMLNVMGTASASFSRRSLYRQEAQARSTASASYHATTGQFGLVLIPNRR